jgi:hypothetical protein
MRAESEYWTQELVLPNFSAGRRSLELAFYSFDWNLTSCASEQVSLKKTFKGGDNQ